MAKSLSKKRMETVLCIVSFAAGTGTGAVVPTPGFELPKQAVIAAGDLAMCVAIYRIWYDVRLSTDEMREMLLDAGFLAVAGGTLVYGGVKLTEGLVHELLNFLGPLGFGIKGLITGSVSGLVGLSFWGICETSPEWLKPKTA